MGDFSEFNDPFSSATGPSFSFGYQTRNFNDGLGTFIKDGWTYSLSSGLSENELMLERNDSTESFQIDIIKETGIEAIYDRVLYLTDLLIEGFNIRDIHIVTPINIRSERSAIVFCSLGSVTSNEKLRSTLEENNIIIAVRDGNCRISPSFYNTEAEIKKFFDVLDTLI